MPTPAKPPIPISLVPNPDPSVRTNESILREITLLKELFETRLDAMDKAISLLQANADKSPTIGELNSKHEEKFRSIQVQFAERDTRTEQTSRDSKVAVDAALQAAKEAVGEQNKSSALAIAKSEASTTKQIDQIAILLQAAQKGTDDKFADIKDRLAASLSRAMDAHPAPSSPWPVIVGSVLFCTIVAIATLIVVSQVKH